MIDAVKSERLFRVRTLQEYFHTSIEDAVTRQRVEIDPHAAQYVVNLLTIFSRSNELFEDHDAHYGLRPLALMLAEAAETDRCEQRAYLLRRIGDVALFISGFFSDGLADKAVDVDYYMHMGGSAYGSLSKEVRGTMRGDAFAPVYQELAAKFCVLVDVLNEVADQARCNSDIDLLRAYDLWLKTGSRRAESQLRQAGVEPIANPADRKH